MTRGKFAIIKDDGVYTSYEFNGDMYVRGNGHGKDVAERLSKVNNEEDFVREVNDFNENEFGYDDEFEKPYFIEKKADFTHATYFDKYFSDYVYLKNLTDETKEIISFEGEKLEIEPNQILVFSFGRLVYKFVDGNFEAIE